MASMFTKRVKNPGCSVTRERRGVAIVPGAPLSSACDGLPSELAASSGGEHTIAAINVEAVSPSVGESPSEAVVARAVSPSVGAPSSVCVEACTVPPGAGGPTRSGEIVMAEASSAEVMRSILVEARSPGFDFDRGDTVPMEDQRGNAGCSSVVNTQENTQERANEAAELVEVEMASVVSVTSSAATTGTSIFPASRPKRKMWQNMIDSSDGNELVQTRNKLRRSNGAGKEGPSARISQFLKSREEVEEGSEVTTQSESENKRSTKSKRKATKSKKNAETIESKLRDVPDDVGELAMAPAVEIGASAIEWIEDVEEIRKKCGNIQGGLSGHMRRRILAVKATVKMLMDKTADLGDPSYLRRRNLELSGDLRMAEKEISRLKNTVKDLQAVVEELKASIREMKSPVAKVTREKATSPMQKEVSPLQQRLVRAAAEPLVARKEQNVANKTREEEEITKQINALVTRRREVRRMAEEERRALPQKQRTKETDKDKGGDEGIRSAREETNQSRQEESWTMVVGRKQKSQNKKAQEKQKKGKSVPNKGSPGKEGGKGEKKKKTVRRRPPRTAAVAVKGLAEDFSYAEDMRKARDQIALADMGIGAPKMRKTANGGVLIEISGPEGPQKAENLRNKLSEVLGDRALVTRPVLKGEIRLIGVDESVSEKEAVEIIAENGDCRIEEVKTGRPRMLSNGMFSIWAQCPLAAAAKIAKVGKIRIGWTVARIEMLKARPIQCFRCWGIGHIREKCKAETDRSGLCYRCGKPGHQARRCDAELCCAVCLAHGMNACHRVGSSLCKAGGKNREQPTGRVDEPMEL